MSKKNRDRRTHGASTEATGDVAEIQARLDASLPEGVTAIVMHENIDMGALHNAISEAVGEEPTIPKIEAVAEVQAEAEAQVPSDGEAEAEAQVPSDGEAAEEVAAAEKEEVDSEILEEFQEQMEMAVAEAEVEETPLPRGLRNYSRDSVIRVVSKRCPKKPGSQAERDWSYYTDGMTIDTYMRDLRMTTRRARANLLWDTNHGYIRIEATEATEATEAEAEAKIVAETADS